MCSRIQHMCTSNMKWHETERTQYIGEHSLIILIMGWDLAIPVHPQLLDMSMVRMDSDMVTRQVSLGHTWCLILSLLSVWSSPLYDMSVWPLLTSATGSVGYHADA